MLNSNTFARAKLFALERLINVESEGLRPGDMVPQSARIHFVRAIASPDSLNAVHLSYLQSRLARFDDIF